MPHTITEARLAPELRFQLVRRQPRTPDGAPDGPLVWDVMIDAVVLDQQGQPVRAISLADILQDLNTGDRTSLTTLAGKIAQRLARRLDIEEG